MCPPSLSSPLLRSRMASSGTGNAAAARAPASSSSSAGGAAAVPSKNPRSVAAAAASSSSGAQQPPPPPQKRKRSLVARLGQSFNPSGIALFGKILLTSSSAPLLLPHLTVRDVSCLDWRALAAAGFKAAVFDKDNTLTAPYSLELTEEAEAALAAAAEAFGKESGGSGGKDSGKSRLALLSNSAGLRQYDPEGHEADALEKALGIAVIRHSSKKPAGDAAAIVRHFGQASSSSSSPSASSSSISAHEVVMVGDRYLTDVAFGNRLGMLTVRVDPIEKSGKGEPRAVRASRAVEEALVRRRGRKGMVAPEQELVERRRGEGGALLREEVLEGFVRR